MIVILATQRPSHQVIDPSLRDLFGYRWAFRCTTDSSSDTVLGHGWAGNPPAIDQGGVSTLTFTLTNGAGNPAQSGINFTDTLPANVTFVSAAAANARQASDPRAPSPSARALQHVELVAARCPAFGFKPSLDDGGKRAQRPSVPSRRRTSSAA